MVLAPSVDLSDRRFYLSRDKTGSEETMGEARV